MTISKRIFCLFIGIIVSISALTGCGGGGSGSNVAYISFDDSDTFGAIIMHEFEKEAQDKGLKVDYYDGKGDVNLQIDYMNEIIKKGVKAIVLVPADSELIVPSVEKADAAGITVITLNRDIKSGRHLEVESDEYEAGKLQAEYMVTHLPQGAKIVYLQGTSNYLSSQQRWEGFKTECLNKRPDVELLDMQDGRYTKTGAMKIMAVWLSLFPKIDAVICGNDQMALGAIASLKAVNRLEGCQVSGVDAVEEALRAIANGEMVQTIKQDAVKQAAGAAEIATAVVNGNPAQNIKVPFISITKENLSEYLK